MSTELSRIAKLAKEDKQRQFTSIAHLMTGEELYAAFLNLREEASAGVDGVRYVEYEENIWENLEKLHSYGNLLAAGAERDPARLLRTLRAVNQLRVTRGTTTVLA